MSSLTTDTSQRVLHRKRRGVAGAGVPAPKHASGTKAAPEESIDEMIGEFLERVERENQRGWNETADLYPSLRSQRHDRIDMRQLARAVADALLDAATIERELRAARLSLSWSAVLLSASIVCASMTTDVWSVMFMAAGGTLVGGTILATRFFTTMRRLERARV